ncbi:MULTISPECIES: hypothetical protein [unclassified Oceanispirochaeta]|uniref:hypothetical protein n=1 Tax=unclassified Oceanispirochaeta TaxID=2635722 RepID=UPI000E093E78|nr:MULTISPECIES: hypothetical protein [unclassified Oceanispirochaeta]MBF9016083.1 hypothetical protein [Oceanispirochaeta sp. M2]NPD72546.1 hypothetical protein [Oceanispirochaeta sp. M1]RDG32003.1 hypothetical protein DV872_10575 [Oceanispirochaeta sp. M1]
MKSNNKYLTKFFFYAFLTLILSGCGLPVYEALDPPTVAFLSSGVNSVAFTSDDDELIDGYVIYYKVYYADDTLIRTEEKQFDPTTYENNDLDEIPSGKTLPEKLGFYKIGFRSRTNRTDPQIPVSVGGSTVIIDFTNSSPQIFGSDPTIYVDNTDMNPDFGIPARSVVYSDAGSAFPNYVNDHTFKRFVRNYEYGSSYKDADISQALSRGGSDIATIDIAFVAYSYGISNTTLEPLSSIPVYLGTVRQTSMSDNNPNTPDNG